MPRPYSPYIPQGRSEIIDHLGSMMLSKPTFEDDSGWFPGKNIETEFYALNEGLRLIRNKVGEEAYRTLVEMSARMRAHFEADPEDKTDDAIAGRQLLNDMEEMLIASYARTAE